MNFRTFFEATGVIDNPNKVSNTILQYKVNTALKPGEQLTFVIPKQYQELILKDVKLHHRYGGGSGPELMHFEKDKDKYRVYYGAYSRIEAHDKTTNTFTTYVDDYGKPYKFAEFRPGDYETENLKNWHKTSKIHPDYIKITNIGNQRPSHPVTKEKLDPNDPRSAVEIGGIDVYFFPPYDVSNLTYFEQIYSTSGQEGKSAAFGDNPTYGYRSKGIYPGALILMTKPENLQKYIKQDNDGKSYRTCPNTAWEFYKSHGGAAASIIEELTGHSMIGNNKKLFEVKLAPGKNSRLEGATLYIKIPSQYVGKKIMQMEAMAGDMKFRPENFIRGTMKDDVNGPALLHMGKASKGGAVWFTPQSGIQVPPYGILPVYPDQSQSVISQGDELVIRSTVDNTYLMGWRVGVG